MKKMWYLFLSLFFAIGIVACEDSGDVTPKPEPTPPAGPTAAPQKVVTEISYVCDGYQTIELSWVDPEEEFEITGYGIVAKCEGQKNISIDVDADDVSVVGGKQTYTIEGLEQPVYSITILAENSFGRQKNGAVLEGVKPFTLESMVMPTFTIIEKEDGHYMKISGLSGLRNVFHHVEFTMTDSSGSEICKGEAAATDEEIVAALDENKATVNIAEAYIDAVLDPEEKYNVEYTIYAYPALGGKSEDGVITYTDILDMKASPASMEGAVSNLIAGVEVQPLFFHFYSFGSAYLKNLNTAVITVPQIYDNSDEGTTKVPRYKTYKIYIGSCEADSQLYVDANGQEGIYTHDDSRWYDAENLDTNAISELNPNETNKAKNLYRDVWAGQAIKTIDLVHKQYPSYVRVEAYDAYDRIVAMGHRLCPTFSVEASQPDIQAHQPKFELLPNNDGLTYTLKASHLSGARAYAKTVKWSIKDEAGDVIAEDKVEGGSYYSDGSSLRHCATLINKDWVVEAKRFVAGRKYIVDYEIEYIPVYHIPDMDDQQPLDYDVETGKFTSTPSGVVDDATGLDHDVRILRDYKRDESGNVLFRTRAEDAEGKVIYAFKHESGDYRGWVAWPSSTVTLTSADMVEAGATLQNEVTAPEDNGSVAAYKVQLELVALKRLNAVKVSWNAYSADDITKVVINDGTEDVVVTADGDYGWTVSNGRGVIELDGVHGVKPLMTVKVYSGDTLLDEEQNIISIFSLDNWEAPVFEWQLQSNGRYKFIAKNLANLSYGFSNNIYEDVAGSEKRGSTIKIYSSEGELLHTLMATQRRDWDAVDWAAYARWALNEQDSWKQWVWSGSMYNSYQPVEDVSQALLPAGTYRIEYEFGYVVNKNGFWSTTDYPYTETSTRPNLSVYPRACVAFPQTSPGLPPQLTDFTNQKNEHVLYCDNRCQQDLPDDGNLNKRKLLKVFVKTGEATLIVGSATSQQ